MEVCVARRACASGQCPRAAHGGNRGPICIGRLPSKSAAMRAYENQHTKQAGGAAGREHSCTAASSPFVEHGVAAVQQGHLAALSHLAHLPHAHFHLAARMGECEGAREGEG